MRPYYLVCAIIGALIPLYFFAQFFFGGDPASADFVSALFVNGATSGFTADLLISSVVFWAYMWNRRTRGPNMIPFIVLNLCIGLSCAFPAYLFVASGSYE